MSSNNAAVPAWEQSIRTHASLSVSSSKTQSDNSMHMLKAAPSTTASWVDDAPLPDDVKNQMLAIHVTSIRAILACTGTFTDTVRGLKNTPPNEDQWRHTMWTAYYLASENFEARISASTEDAIQIIRNLPHQQQNGAASMYSYVLNIVNQLVNRAVDAISGVIKYTKEFLSGIWTKVTDAYNMVQTWCSDALSTLRSLFNFVAVLSVAEPGHAIDTETVQDSKGFVG